MFLQYHSHGKVSIEPATYDLSHAASHNLHLPEIKIKQLIKQL